MIDFFIYKPSGEIICSGRCPQNMLEMQGAHLEGVTVQEGVASWETDYILDGNVTPKGVRPSADHKFDYTLRQWVDPRTLDDLKELQLVKVDTERAVRNVAPIEYAGRSLDADLLAQKNISDKLSEIKAREDMGQTMPPELMLWRDADNQNETFADMRAMKSWLQGLVVAIAQRGTEAYIWAWQTKAAIAAATTRAELDAISW